MDNPTRARLLEANPHTFSFLWRRGPRRPLCENPSCARRESFEPSSWSRLAATSCSGLSCTLCEKGGMPKHESTFCSKGSVSRVNVVCVVCDDILYFFFIPILCSCVVPWIDLCLSTILFSSLFRVSVVSLLRGNPIASLATQDSTLCNDAMTWMVVEAVEGDMGVVTIAVGTATVTAIPLTPRTP